MLRALRRSSSWQPARPRPSRRCGSSTARSHATARRGGWRSRCARSRSASATSMKRRWGRRRAWRSTPRASRRGAARLLRRQGRRRRSRCAASTTPKGEYVAVTVHIAGKPAPRCCPPMLATLATAAHVSRRPCAGWPTTRASRRPVRWLLALLGDDVLPVQAFGLDGRARDARASLPRARRGRAEARARRGLRDGARAGVRARRSREAREAGCASSSSASRRRVAGRRHDRRRAGRHQQLHGRVAHGVLGHSSTPSTSSCRDEVIVTALREHQRFFACSRKVRRRAARTTCCRAFIGGAQRRRARPRRSSRKGSEDVLVARLEDARFYWETDLKKPPAGAGRSPASVVWMEGLGSLLDKAQRLQSLGAWLAQRLAPAEPRRTSSARRCCARPTCLSEMIGSGKEYASLEGMIGGYYARRAGEPREVCDAISWHYHPRWAGDALPKTERGRAAVAGRQAGPRRRRVRGRQDRRAAARIPTACAAPPTVRSAS